MPQEIDSTRVFTLETQADLYALRAIASTPLVVYIVPVDGGWRLSLAAEGAITRWSRFGCESLKPIAALVERVDLIYGGFPCQDVSNAGRPEET